jgi:hypothetical protein
MNLTGIQNVGEFYSHHYLDALLENDLKGLFAQWRAEDEDTPDKRLNRLAASFYQARQAALRARTDEARYKASHAFHVDLLEALGYDYHFEVRYLLEGEAVPVLGTERRDGQEYVWLVETPFCGEDDSPLEQGILAEQYPKQSQEVELQFPEEQWEALIAEIFRRDSPPRWVILLAGGLVFLCDRTKWGYGQYLLFDLDEIYGRRQPETLRATAALLARDALAPDDGIPLHDTLDEKSHKHAYGVSKDLKYGVRQAVELLANEYIWYQRQKGHEKLYQDPDLARKLTDEALTYLYRLLFLFYAEARGGELSVVPMKSEAFRTGYSLEMLRDLEQVPLNTPQAQNGYFIDHSLEKLFGLVNEGYGIQPQQLLLGESEMIYEEYGFSLPGLHNPLFDPASTPLLSGARFRNVVLQEIIQLLSLSREESRRRHGRGRISYAQLGINQLGAVYEGLLSFSGFFAQEDLYEVKSASDTHVTPDTQTYFIPKSERERYTADEFVYDEMPDGTRQRRVISKGAFVFRMAGRDREKSASYYTPEVLTECVVKYSLKELLKDKSAADILKLTICEPAMGSGAFINEALNQLADAYLERAQAESGEHIPPDAYRQERQKVKAYLAVNNAYGVDLNPTAVELARVSLWLNIIYEGADSPWFGPRLATGNSLIGARRQVYSAEEVFSGGYAGKAPEDVPLGDGKGGFGPRPAGSVYHWLLPDKGMAAFDSDKVIKELAPKEVQAIKDWRKDFTRKISKAELKTMQALSDAADKLWEANWRERQMVIERTRQHTPVWGTPQAESGPLLAVSHQQSQNLSVQQCEKELAYLERPTSPYRRLKLAMDTWCALWFWPIPEANKLPTREQYLNQIGELFKNAAEEFERLPEQLDLFAAPQPQPKQMGFSDLPAPDVDELCRQHPALAQARVTADQMRFHHWELVFSEVFVGRGGFDLIVGNPPWVKLGWDEGGLLSDYEPIIAIRRYSASRIVELRDELIKIKILVEEYIINFYKTVGEISFLSSICNYDKLRDIQKSNLYKCFMVKSWDVATDIGFIGLLHPEGVYEDPRGGNFRKEIYPRLQAHYQFHNELLLFSDVHHQTIFSINIYSSIAKPTVRFDHIVNLYHPSTIDNCYHHDGVGMVPGSRNQYGSWNLQGHKNRIINISKQQLDIFATLYDDTSISPLAARLPLVHSKELLSVLSKFSEQKTRLGDLKEYYFATVMWDQNSAQKKGIIKSRTQYPENPTQLILSGPHFYVATPIYKNPNENCRHNLDYSNIDLTDIPDNFLPRTNFIPMQNDQEYLAQQPKWNNTPIFMKYKHIHRRMLGITAERTLINAIAIPYSGHVNTVFSITFSENVDLVTFSGLCSSIVYDFFVKSTGRSDMYEDLSAMLPIVRKNRTPLINRTLRLNCLTDYYADLWEDQFLIDFYNETWTKQDARLSEWEHLTPRWGWNTPLRTPFERRQALVEIDVLAAMALELTVDELLTIYRVQFPVLQKNERRLLFDQRGMEVPVKTVAGELGVDEGHEKFPEMVPPFTPVDREADYRQAWAHFEERLASD